MALCASLLRTTSNMNKVFCPHCGNQTLKKVAVTLNDDGSVHMHFSKNPKVLNPTGLRVRHTTTHSHTVPCFLLRLLISEEAAEIRSVSLCKYTRKLCVYTACIMRQVVFFLNNFIIEQLQCPLSIQTVNKASNMNIYVVKVNI